MDAGSENNWVGTYFRYSREQTENVDILASIARQIIYMQSVPAQERLLN